MFREMIFHNETDSTPVSTFRSLNGFASALPVSRKRSRDSFSFNPSLINATNVDLNQHQFDQFGEFTFLNEDISLQMYQQQLEIDQLIFHHVSNIIDLFISILSGYIQWYVSFLKFNI